MGNNGSVCDNSDSPALGSSSSEQNYPQNSEGDDCKELNDKLPPEFSSKYQAVSKIGSGSFGNVYKVRDNKTKAIYAAKMVDLQHHHSPLEVQIQTTINNKHVVKIYDTISIQEGRKLFIIMEYCEGGNLLQWIKRNRKHKLLNEKLILQMLQELCDAVYSCHQKRVVHRDLKPENILLDGKRRVKLADFGVARILDKSTYATSFCGTPPYMAPELFLSYLSKSSQSGVVGYDAKCDVWSIGCILWDMANTSNTFTFELSNHVGLNVAQATSESIGAREIQDLIEKDVPQDYRITKRLLRSMLKKNPDERATLSEILQDRELREALENPMDSHWSDML